jgi:hypothetical protein
VSPAEIKRAIIDKDVLLPLGLVVALIMSLIGGYVWLDDRFDTIEEELREQRRIIIGNTANRWTSTMQERWAWRTQEAIRDQLGKDPAAAASFRIPDPIDVVRHPKE